MFVQNTLKSVAPCGFVALLIQCTDYVLLLP